MNNEEEKEYELVLGSVLKAYRRKFSPGQVSKVIIDTLGIYDASEIASYIRESENLEKNENGHNEF